MKLHPKAKAALRYHNAHSKQRDIEKCDFSKAAHAISALEEYAPKIATRISATYREMQSGWFLYLGAEFLIHLETKPQSFLDAFYQMGEELNENPNENLTEFLNDIPF